MTTDHLETNADPKAELIKLEENFARIEELTQRIIRAFSHKKQVPTALQGPGSDLYLRAYQAYFAEWMANPGKVFEQQVAYWGKSLKHFIDAQQSLAKGAFEVPVDATPDDRRFANPLWKTNPYFNFIKQQYMMNAQAIGEAVENLVGIDEKERARLRYFSAQIADMMCPTNFLGTNPDALERAVATEGQSLVDGLENLVRDLEANHGELIVRLADEKAFQVGGNLGTTPGKVVFRNRMLELVQYSPTTEQVYETPLLIFPPWINKFYILDLKEKNSLIKWIVDQGYTLFVVSWVNPDSSYRDVGMQDYIEDGYLAAINEVKKICDVPQVNAVGYCIAGTTLSLTLSLLKQRGDSSVNSATFFTTLTDFSDQGEFGVFLTDDFVDGIEAEAGQQGILESFYMARTFSYLRSRDLIYAPAIRSYMMGEAPPAFDLLFWNGDGTNLPAKMAVEYLRGLCQGNRFAEDGFEVAGGIAKISEVDVPVCAIACETDHIAAWAASYNGIKQMGSTDKTFILSQSGHIAGIVNPPSKKKYDHYLNDNLTVDPADWLAGATRVDGSWWPTWDKWLAPRSGNKIDARQPGKGPNKALCDAPGTYVKAQPKVD